MTQAFSGLTIIDFSQVLAGPYATQLFAMLGANIIKVEPPGKGDQLRAMFPDEATAAYGMGAAFISANVGKRSIAIDLKHPKSKEILNKLIADADAIVENFKGGVIERLGYGYEDVIKINPEIVYCSVSGYGKTGPMANAPAYDGAIQAASGMMSITGNPETGPTRTGFMCVDVPTALTSAFALASALYRKLATGKGQKVDVSMMDAAMTLMGANYSAFMHGRTDQGLVGNDSPTKLPTANVFPTQDGFVQITALTEDHAQLVLQTLGLQSLLDDPATALNEGRTEHAEIVKEKMAAQTKKETTETWLARLREKAIPCAPIRSMTDVLVDPQLDYREIVRPMPRPDGSAGDMKVIGAAFTANQDGPAIPRPSPMLGRDSEAILSEIGYSDDDIAGLLADGVVAI